MNIDTLRARVFRLGGHVANLAWAGYDHDIHTRLYLYYTPAVPDGEWGDLKVADSLPDGFTLADPQHIPRDKTLDGMAAWVRERLQHLPICGAS